MILSNHLLFVRARALNGSDQFNYLEKNCRNKQHINEILELLQNHKVAEACGFFEHLVKKSNDTTPEIEGIEILQLIGRGGMGEVYLGRDLDLGRKVALKLLSPELTPPEFEQRFHREAQLLGSLNHEAFGRILSTTTTKNGDRCLVLEYIPGIPIDEFCEVNRLSIQERASLLLKVALALRDLHAQGLVHRDIKPSNLLVYLKEKVTVLKIIDFGITRSVSTDSENEFKTESGKVFGTPAYMSPEQLRGSKCTTGQVDLYSFGCIALNLFCGELAVFGWANGLRESPSNYLRNQSQSDIEKLSQDRSTSPKSLIKDVKRYDFILKKILNDEVSQRYESAECVIEDMNRAITINADPMRTKFLIAISISILTLGFLVFLHYYLAIWNPNATRVTKSTSGNSTEKLSPNSWPDPRVQRWLKDLGSRDINVIKKAQAELTHIATKDVTNRIFILDRLSEQLTDKNYRIRIHSIATMGGIGPRASKKASSALALALNHEPNFSSPEIMATLITCTSKARPEVIPHLLPFLESKFRGTVIWAITENKGAEALDYLQAEEQRVKGTALAKEIQILRKTILKNLEK